MIERLPVKKRGQYRAVLISTVVILGTIWVAWHLFLEPILILVKVHKTQLRLQMAVIAFSTVHDRLPRNIEEMVNAKVLPNEGEIYYSPIVNETLVSKSLPYLQCEYEFSFTDETTTIRIPRETPKCVSLRFRWLMPKNVGIKVQKGTKFGDPSATNEWQFN